MTQPLLSIIIINFNSKKYLFESLRSIRQFVMGFDYEIIVADNASTKEKLEPDELKEFKVRFIRLEKNLGFGTGNNQAAKVAQGEYLLLLNPDTLIVDDSITKMVVFLEKHKEIGALTPLLYQEDGKTLQKNFYCKFQSLGTLTIRRYNYQPIDFQEEYMKTDVVVAACLMVKKEIFDSIKGFDENIFMYLEDDDICKRIRDLGYENAVLTTAKIIHLEGKSSNYQTKKIYYYKSQSYFWRKHYGLFRTILMQIVRWPLKVIKTRRLFS